MRLDGARVRAACRRFPKGSLLPLTGVFHAGKNPSTPPRAGPSPLPKAEASHAIRPRAMGRVFSPQPHDVPDSRGVAPGWNKEALQALGEASCLERIPPFALFSAENFERRSPEVTGFDLYCDKVLSSVSEIHNFSV